MSAIKCAKWMLPLTALLAGCASTPQVRTLAERTGTFVTSLEQGTTGFVTAQNHLNANNEATLRSLGGQATALRMQVAQQRLASTDAGHRDLLQSQALATSVTAADIVASLQPPPAVRPATVKFEGGEGYGKATKALVDVGTKPTAAAVIAGLISYAEAVRDSHAALLEDAKDSAASAGAQTVATAQNAAAAGKVDAVVKKDKKEK